MEDLIKDQQTQLRTTTRPPTLVGKENQQTPLKERVWQDELLEAYLPRALDESQHQQQPQQEPEIKNETKSPSSQSKVIVLASGTQDQKLLSIIKMSLFVSLVTAFLLWFFEPSFVQSVSVSSVRSGQKDLLLNNDGDIYVSSRVKIVFWSLLAGAFAFSVLYSIPD
jgi:hypothetical protein